MERYGRVPKTDEGDALQLPAWSGPPIHVSVGTTASSAINLQGAAGFRWYSDTDSFMKFGDDTVAASASFSDSHFVPAGVENICQPDGTTHMSVIRAVTIGDGQLTLLR